MKTKCLFFIFILILGYSCKKQHQQQSEALVTITPAADENFVSDLSNYIDTISIVPLEAQEQSLISHISKMLVLPNGNFIIPGNRFLVFSSTGQYLSSFGAQGKGPEEYPGVIDFCLGQNGKEVWMLTSAEDIVGYNIESGAFIKRIKPEKTESHMNFEAIASGYDGSFFLFMTNYYDGDNVQNFNNLLHIAADGKPLHAYLPQKDYIFNIALITQSFDNQYILRPQNADNICYYLKDSIPVARIKIDFGAKTASNKLSPDIQTYFRSDHYKFPIYIHETAEQFFFTYCGPEAREHYCVHSFDSGKTITWKRTGNDSEGLFQFYGSDQDFFYGIYSDYRTTDEIPLEETDLLKRAIIEKTRIQLLEDSNPCLVKIKFKL